MGLTNKKKKDLLEEIKPQIISEEIKPNNAMEIKLNALKDNENQPEEKRGRGRPKGSKNSSSKENDLPDIIPLPDLNESKMFANIISGAFNMFVKPEYKDRLNLQPQELEFFCNGLSQLKQYYIPNIGGIYAVILTTIGSGAMIGISKYKIIQEIIKEEKQNGTGNAAGDSKPLPEQPAA